MFLSVAAAGGRYIEIEPKWAFDGENVPGQITHFKQWAHNLRWIGRRRAQIDIDLDPSGPMRALKLFTRMINTKTIIPACEPASVVSISPVHFQVQHTKHWGAWGLFHRGIDKQFYDNCCPNYTEISVQTPSQDAFSYLYNSSHFYDQTLPMTPYGLVSIFPFETQQSKSNDIFATDGNNVFCNGRSLSAMQAADIIQKAYSNAADDLPFMVQKCTWSAIKVGPADYLIILIDPEERFPLGVNTMLKVNLLRSWHAFDGLSSLPLPAKDNCIPVSIKPAGFRLIRVIEDKKP
jgi:hypothetical protein